MCGIAGYLTQGDAPDPALLRRMCDRIAHRGPDGDGYFVGENAALGHRRLSIIDVEGGRQPLGNEDGSIQIVFNGEIYNFQELHAGLVARGHRFATRSDTEVLVHLYEEVGEALPEHLNGMFAFAIWDRRNRKLFLARDRFGEKPLYWSDSIPGFRFAFASELKALMALPGFDATVRRESVAEFLNFGYIADPETIYRGVWKLEAGHSLMFTDRGPSKRRYWRLEFTDGAGTPPLQDLEAIARESVEMRMISDVPLGGFLSGGVDSSGVVAFMADKSALPVKTFSIGFANKQFDELDYARQIATRYRTDHYEKTVHPQIEEMLDTLVSHYDEPFGDSSAIPTLYLARMTRERVTVALSGDGADELFGGYRRYWLGVVEDQARDVLPEWFRKTAVRGLASVYPKLDFLPRPLRAKATLNGIAGDLPNAYYAAMSRFRDHGLSRLLSPDLLSGLGGYSTRDKFVDRFAAVKHLSALKQMQAVDLETYLPGDILVKVDRATMAYSLESRAPWLDHRLAEMAAALPVSAKLNGREGKFLFKKMLEPHVPRDLLYRPKMGFVVPLGSWLKSSLKPLFELLVLSPSMEEYLSISEVRRLWKEHQQGIGNHESQLWNLLMLACWRIRHVENAPQLPFSSGVVA